MSIWFNFKTKEYDYLEKSPEDYQDYIPQDAGAQCAYKILVEFKKLSPINAALTVLKKCAEIEND